MLNGALDETNNLGIPTENRRAVLELLSDPVMCITDALRKQFLGRPLPLHEEERNAVMQALGICNRMATGYRILADDLGTQQHQAQRLATAIHRALRYLGELLLIHYQIYVQYPNGLWKGMHALYALAEECSLTGYPVSDPTPSGSGDNTIATVYRQILLLSLAGPYRMRQKEIHFVCRALPDWARTCRLAPASDARASGLFMVDLQSDNPPAYRVLAHQRPAGTYTRILDTTAATDRLRDALSAGNAQAGTLQQLMLAWGAMLKRSFPRHCKQASVNLVCGITAIHGLSAGPDAQDLGKGDAITDHDCLPDPTFDSTTTFPTGMEPEDSPLRGAYTADTEQRSRIEHWRMVDTSAGGYCLLWDNAFATGAHVGELVALRHENGKPGDNWQLGVIRWMKFTGERGLELGVQLLAPANEAVWAFACNVDPGPVPRADKRMQGLLLPAIRVLQQQASLLPAPPFRAGQHAILEANGRRETIILTRELENTGAFAQFHFAPADSR